MNKAFLISTVTALALGYSAGFASNDLVANAAKPISQLFNYSFEVGGSAKTAVTTWAKNNACPRLDTELALTGSASCDADKDLRKVCFEFSNRDGTRKLYADVLFERAGTYTPADPQ